MDALESALKISEANFEELADLSEKRQEDLLATVTALQEKVQALKVLLPDDARSRQIPAEEWENLGNDCMNDPILETENPSDLGPAQPSSYYTAIVSIRAGETARTTVTEDNRGYKQKKVRVEEWDIPKMAIKEHSFRSLSVDSDGVLIYEYPSSLHAVNKPHHASGLG